MTLYGITISRDSSPSTANLKTIQGSLDDNLNEEQRGMLEGLSAPVFYCTNNECEAKSDGDYDASRVFTLESNVEEMFEGNDPELVLGEKIFVEFDNGRKYVASDNVRLFTFLEIINHSGPAKVKGVDKDDSNFLKEFKNHGNAVYITTSEE